MLLIVLIVIAIFNFVLLFNSYYFTKEFLKNYHILFYVYTSTCLRNCIMMIVTIFTIGDF